MQLSDLSVRRPVFATVIAILLCVVGAVAFMSLSVREYPDTDPPVVSVQTTYTGAAASVAESRITQVPSKRSLPVSRAYWRSVRGRAMASPRSPLNSTLAAISIQPPMTCATGSQVPSRTCPRKRWRRRFARPIRIPADPFPGGVEAGLEQAGTE